MKQIADWIPPKIRAAIYAAIGTAILLESIWGIIPENIENKLMTSLSVLGFGMAVTQTPVGEQ